MASQHGPEFIIIILFCNDYRTVAWTVSCPECTIDSYSDAFMRLRTCQLGSPTGCEQIYVLLA